MIRTVHSMIRVASVAAVLLSVGAIGLGRLAPKDRGRTRVPARLVGVSSSYRDAVDRGLQVFDLRDETRRSFPMEPGERIDLAVAAPWVDPEGRRHLVGRWIKKGPGGSLDECGIGRVADPTGEVLDRVPLEHYPVSPPCWGAGTSARVLFVAGDGNLYRYDFEPVYDDGSLTGSSGLSPVAWEVPPERDAELALIDVARPDECFGSDLLLASVMRLDSDDSGALDHSEIWWLRLSPDERAVVDCGPVTSPDPECLDRSRRRPSLGLRHDGTPWLAYLSWQGDAREFAVRIVPVRLDERTGAPAVAEPSGRILATDCLNEPPIFLDGGRALAVQAHDGRRAVLRRVPLDDPPPPAAD